MCTIDTGSAEIVLQETGNSCSSIIYTDLHVSLVSVILKELQGGAGQKQYFFADLQHTIQFQIFAGVCI